MTQAKNGDTVRIHYSGRFADGTEFDSSWGNDPLEFKIGSGAIIPGFEEAVIGMTVGSKQTVVIPADEAYGPHEPGRVQEVERSMIPDDIEVEVGSRLKAVAPGGQALAVTVVDINDATVTLDANHPLAGRDLTFDIELVEIV